MNKFTWVLVESILAGIGLGYTLFGYLENYPASTIALSFTFGIVLSLIVLGMSGRRG